MPTIRSLLRSKLPNGEVWKNLVIEEKTKSAQTLAEFRGNWKYNLARQEPGFNAEIPTISQWDDHEIPEQLVAWRTVDACRVPTQEICREKHTHPDGPALTAHMREYLPMIEEPTEPGRIYRNISYGPLLDVFMLDMRSYRGPNAENMQEINGPDAYFLGPEQVTWLKRELLNSRAPWKVIANDMPLALIRIYNPDRNWGHDAIAQGDNGPPRGRELELADILSFIKRGKIHNTVWLTADVHYTAAHYFDPNQAAFPDFDPFWEFVSGPIHAGTGMPKSDRQDVRATSGLCESATEELELLRSPE